MVFKFKKFKAKLTWKEKSDKKNSDSQVVCLKYKIHGDVYETGQSTSFIPAPPPNSYLNSTNSMSLKISKSEPNLNITPKLTKDVVKIPKSIIKPTAQDIFQHENSKSGENKPEINYPKISNEIFQNENSKSRENKRERVIGENGITTKKHEPPKSQKVKKSAPKAPGIKPLTTNDSEENEKSTLLHMTSKNDDIQSKSILNKDTEDEDFDGTFEFAFVKRTVEPKAESKVENAQLQSPTSISSNNSELYSSQAASIFFNDEEPEPNERIRNIAIENDENNSVSSQTSA